MQPAGGDEAACDEVLLGAGETVGVGERRLGGGAGGEDNGDPFREGGEGVDEGFGNGADAESGDDEAVEAGAYGAEEGRVVIEGDRMQADGRLSGGFRHGHGQPVGHPAHAVSDRTGPAKTEP